jgi:hypothetical protein
MSTSCQDQKCHEEKVLVADKVKDLIENCEEQKVFNKKVENHFIHYIKKTICCCYYSSSHINFSSII